MNRKLHIGIVAAAALALAAPAGAYYHYVHFLGSGPPYVAAYEKFDLRALPGKTVSVYVSDSGPAQAEAFAAVLSQIREAAKVWNGVASSDLRVAFGGLKADRQTVNTPGIDVIFTADLPPGVLAAAAPTVGESAIDADGNAFFPIVGSVVMLNSDTSVPPGPSYSENYFTTVVHEMGHALGLQHTFTTGAMSQAVIRNTSRAKPLGPDDAAGLSELYGTPGWKSAYGSITGRITSNGNPVSMASVVALPLVSSPVSAITDPDGTYRIDGVPPGQYVLYVHPLPPSADVRNPRDAGGESIAAAAPFETVFLKGDGVSGTRNFQEISPVSVKAGAVNEGQSVDVQGRDGVPIYDVVTFSYFDSAKRSYSWSGNALTPAFVNAYQTATDGIATMTFTAPSLKMPESVALLGGFQNIEASLCCDSQAVALYFYLPLMAKAGPRHMVLQFADDMYVLPNAVTVVENNPPAIETAAEDENGGVAVTGRNFDETTRIFFDGLPAKVQTPFAGDATEGTIVVLPPPGAGGQVATITAYNADGQSSTTLDGAALAYGRPLQTPQATYFYPEAPSPQIQISPSNLPGRTLAKVDFTVTGMQLSEADITAGFGGQDVSVQQVWTLGPDHLAANVAVLPNAAPGTSEVTLISGFQRATIPNGFRISPADETKPAIGAVTNGISTQATVYRGGYATIHGSNLTSSGQLPTATLNGIGLTLASWSPTEINLLIPQGFPIGPATLALNNGLAEAPAVMVPIELPPPAIAGQYYANGQPITWDTPVLNGNAIRIEVTGLDPAAAEDRSRLRVTIGETAAQITLVETDQERGSHYVWIVVAGVPPGDLRLAVWVDGSSSAPAPVTIAAPPESAP